MKLCLVTPCDPDKSSALAAVSEGMIAELRTKGQTVDVIGAADPSLDQLGIAYLPLLTIQRTRDAELRMGLIRRWLAWEGG